MKKIIIIPSLLISAKVFSQRPVTGMWLAAQFPVSINKKWQWHNDGGYRTLGNSIAPLQYLYRTGLRYSINKNWSTAAGVAFFFSRTTFSKKNDEFAKEFRLWEEATFKKEVTKNLQTLSRLRIEQRSFAATTTKTSYHAFRYRLRTQLQQKIANKLALQLADEYMQQYKNNTWSFDQNRLITNAVYFFNKQTQLLAGYMWLRWPAHSSQHILNIGFQKIISFHAKQ